MATKRNRSVASEPSLTDEALLWQARTDDPAAREQLIEFYLPFARTVAARIYSGRVDSDLEFAEYLQFATVGLIEAVDRYDPLRATQFKTFASFRISGAILNGIEHLSEKREQLSARKSLLAERCASGKAALDQPGKDLFQQLAEVAVGMALGYLLDDSSTTEANTSIAPESHYGGIELRQLQDRIHTLIDSLPQRERMVIKYHYLNQVPFTVIADYLGLTKGRVSQIHRQALLKLRENIKTVKTCDIAW